MNEEELFTHYGLDECVDRKSVINKLKSLKSEGKITYNFIEQDVLFIKDIDLEDSDINNILTLFDKNDVFPLFDYDNSDEFDDDGESFDYDSDDI